MPALDWVTVGRDAPCMICDKPDWCARSSDGVWMICRRLDAGGRHRVDAGGTDFWLYSTDDSVNVATVVVPPLPVVRAQARAEVEVLDQVYQDVLVALTLSDAHREQLAGRGLSEEWIEARMYRTLNQDARTKVVADVQETHDGGQLLQVPGFFRRRRRGGDVLALGGDGGLWIPVTNVQGQIIAIKVRRDSEEGIRYRYVSSRSHDGPGPGSPIHVPPGFDGDTEVVRLTEGELKADVATHISGVLTVSKAGVSQWRAALPVLEELGARSVIMADDSDVWKNRHVAGAVQHGVEGLRDSGYSVSMEHWDPERAKGIDDLMALGNHPETASGDDVDDLVGRMVEAAAAASPTDEEESLRKAIAHGHTIAETVRDDPGTPFEGRALKSLNHVRTFSLPDWQRISAKLWKAGVGRRDLDAALTEERKTNGVAPSPRPASDVGSENGHKDDDGPPWIMQSGRWMHEITGDALKVLLPENGDEPDIFEKSGTLVTVTEAGNHLASRVITHATMKGMLDRRARWVKYDRQGEVTPARVADDVVQDILSLEDSPFPTLTAISQVPLVLPDGQLGTTDGYDPESGYVMRLNGLSAVRTNMEVDQALDLLLGEVLVDFPFVDLASQAHALCLFLQPFLMPLIASVTPMYVIEAATTGTGKGILADVANILTHNGNVGTVSGPTDEEELRKRLFSELLESRTLIMLDDVATLRSRTLNRFLTSHVLSDRLLGANRMSTVTNNATWLTTGNNLELSDEMARRSVLIRLVSAHEQPSQRSPSDFKHPELRAWVRSHRVQLVSACLSLIQAWLDAGQPNGRETLGSFERWARVMGGILEVAKVPGFLENLSNVRQDSDELTSDWNAFLDLWWEAHGDNRVRVADLMSILREHVLLGPLWSNRTQLGGQQSVGRAVRRQRDRRFRRFVIRLYRGLSKSSASLYFLEQVE